VVEYKYSPLNPLYSVEVIYEGGRRVASGSITMYANGALEARLIDIRDIWKITFNYTDKTISAITFKIDVSGSDVLSGTFSDDRGYNGTWDASNGKIKIIYTNWKNYLLSGTSLYDMTGSWTGESKTGTWSATRD